jgi:hypothetical protein
MSSERTLLLGKSVHHPADVPATQCDERRRVPSQRVGMMRGVEPRPADSSEDRQEAGLVCPVRFEEGCQA